MDKGKIIEQGTHRELIALGGKYAYLVKLLSLEENTVMRRICDVRTMGAGEVDIPVSVDQGEASWLDELEEYGVTDDKFGILHLKARKLGRIVKLSEELLADSAFDMETELTLSLGESFRKAEERAFINGDGVKTPKGFLRSIVGPRESMAFGAISYDDVVKLKHDVLAPYRINANWLLSDSAALQLSLLKDGEGRPIWQNSMQLGTPDMLLGRPVEYSAYMPEFENGAMPIAFGDFKRYRIADRSGLSIMRLDQLYAATGQIGFRGRRRVDGALLDTQAIKVLKIKGA